MFLKRNQCTGSEYRGPDRNVFEVWDYLVENEGGLIIFGSVVWVKRYCFYPFVACNTNEIMKTSELYKSYFEALQGKWENPVREFLKAKLSYRLRINERSHGIAVKHKERNGDLIMLLQLEKLMDEFRDSKFHPLHCPGQEFDPDRTKECIEKERIKEEERVNWDCLTRRKRLPEHPSVFDEKDNPIYDDLVKEGPFEILELYGVYRSSAPRSFRSQVEIFISKIYYDCLEFGWDVEALYVIVLCHELAHGFHHLGIDSDDNYWVNYRNLDTSIKEGLAQYYTEKFITSNNECKSKKFIKVFDDLCSFQPKEYTVHKYWPKLSYEASRIVMVESRKKNIDRYTPFRKIIDHYSKKGI